MKANTNFFSIVVLAAIVSITSGCSSSLPKGALKLSPSLLADRQMQSRIYDDVTEAQILSASVGVFQDLGLNITAAESTLGLLVGEKNRDAVETGQVVSKVFANIISLGKIDPKIDKDQRIKFSLVTRRTKEHSYVARLTIQRLVWNSIGDVTKVEMINTPDIYESFFKKMEQSLFLEENI